jgi:hypothetical protein
MEMIAVKEGAKINLVAFLGDTPTAKAYRKRPPWLGGGKSSTADSISSSVIVLIPSNVSVFRHR